MNASPALKSILGREGLTDAQLRRAGVTVLGDQSSRTSGPVSDSPQLLRAALDYAARGWCVIPLHTPTAQGCSCGRADCTSVGKHPRVAHGSKDASCDPAVIRAWWDRWPDANVGIATGQASGLLALDVDGAQGEQSLVDLAQRGFILPDTYSVRTGSGGAHHYFAWPEGADVRNSARKIAPGLDIRGVGGVVAAPPSMHKSGRRYEVSESAIDAAPCPEWLLSLIREAQGPATRQSAPAAGAVASESIGKGQRTNRLVSLAGSMHKRGMTPEAIEAALLTENRAKNDPPLPETKVRAIACDIPARYPNPGPEEKPSLKLDLVRLADVEARAVDWLWKRYLALGMLAMLSGDPGAGKTFLALAIAAGYTVGRTPDGERCEPITVLYLSIENALAEVVRVRFNVLGGDASRFFALRGTLCAVDGEEHRGTVTLADVQILERAIVETGARLVIIDPIQSYLGATVDLHRSNETRPVLDGLAKLAEQCRCCILLIRHLSKQSGGKAITRGLGSIDLSGAVRSEMLAGSLPDDPEARALVHIKSNIGPYGPTRGYSIDGEGRFTWTGESKITAVQILAAPESPDRKLAEAVQWLSEKLMAGSLEQREIKEQAEAAGISYRTLVRAKVALRCGSRKSGFGSGWIWWLPANEPESGAVQ